MQTSCKKLALRSLYTAVVRGRCVGYFLTPKADDATQLRAALQAERARTMERELECLKWKALVEEAAPGGESGPMTKVSFANLDGIMAVAFLVANTMY